ncbi:MAG: DUF4199 domain-containing protein [Spirosomaceae bacterium]|jgi:hypothetical protein|nr:DUF4199 domain-containing protein [Spirosomataceae bacterium]
MQKVVLKFGLIAGAIMGGTMLVSMLVYRWQDWGDSAFEYGAYFGYASMLLALLFVYLGIKSYREQYGHLSFGKGLQVGLLVTAVACVCYALVWLVCYYNIYPTFMEDYNAYHLKQLQKANLSPTEMAEEIAAMKDFAQLYKNPLINFGITLMEPLPVGLLVSLVSAWVLKSK